MTSQVTKNPRVKMLKKRNGRVNQSTNGSLCILSKEKVFFLYIKITHCYIILITRAVKGTRAELERNPLKKKRTLCPQQIYSYTSDLHFLSSQNHSIKPLLNWRVQHIFRSAETLCNNTREQSAHYIRSQTGEERGMFECPFCFGKALSHLLADPVAVVMVEVVNPAL